MQTLWLNSGSRKWFVLKNERQGLAPLGADVAEHVQLLFVFSAHAFFLSGCVVQTKVPCDTGPVCPKIHRCKSKPVRGHLYNVRPVVIDARCLIT
jgi:hypothetical protein